MLSRSDQGPLALTYAIDFLLAHSQVTGCAHSHAHPHSLQHAYVRMYVRIYVDVRAFTSLHILLVTYARKFTHVRPHLNGTLKI